MACRESDICAGAYSIKNLIQGSPRMIDEKELRRVQAELCKLQHGVKYKGLRAIVTFEVRDAAGSRALS